MTEENLQEPIHDDAHNETEKISESTAQASNTPEIEHDIEYELESGASLDEIISHVAHGEAANTSLASEAISQHTPEFQERYHTEAEILRDYMSRFVELNGGKPVEVKGIVGFDAERNPSRAWAVTLTPYGTGEVGIGEDSDDTMEWYTSRKDRLYTEYAAFMPEMDAATKEKLLMAFMAFNKVGRVLPKTGTHPERYVPLLEIEAASDLIGAVTRGEKPAILTDTTTDMATLAKSYIAERILPKMRDEIVLETEEKDGKTKEYFREHVLEGASVNFQKKPDAVDERVWDAYKKYMTEANIPENELPNFDLSPDVPWIIITSGELESQIEKVMNNLRVLKAHGLRLPNQILFCTRGMKEPILEKFIHESGLGTLIYLDDRPSQMENLPDNIIPLCATRTGVKPREDEHASSIPQVAMEITPMSEFLQIARQGR